eukprot:TRINITY_DN6661_c0_g1_i2.p1 TRINITY_DN6661_c0_g1~~TRINITY_DN6661_c0_g1_i2.p1  ORF type:complete len:398 (+),score=73.22 TRINITY_DN6661_c0_g1_i2:14-1207(+)
MLRSPPNRNLLIIISIISIYSLIGNHKPTQTLRNEVTINQDENGEIMINLNDIFFKENSFGVKIDQQHISVVPFLSSSYARGKFYRDDVGWVMNIDATDFYYLGFLEGYFTSDLITLFYGEYQRWFIEMYSLGVWENVYSQVIRVFDDTILDIENEKIDNWEVINQSIVQMRGITDGHNHYCNIENRFTIYDIVMLNALDEINVFLNISEMSSDDIHKLFKRTFGSSHVLNPASGYHSHVKYVPPLLKRFNIKKNIYVKSPYNSDREYFLSWPGVISPLNTLYYNTKYYVSGIPIDTLHDKAENITEKNSFTFLRYRTANLLASNIDHWKDIFLDTLDKWNYQLYIFNKETCLMIEQYGKAISQYISILYSHVALKKKPANGILEIYSLPKKPTPSK